MNTGLKLYRKRIIPQECRPLTGDEIVLADDEVVITKWDTINPKTEFTHGCSCYFLKQGFKISKFYRHDNTLLYWYCDIVDFDYNAADNELIVTDLLADVKRRGALVDAYLRDEILPLEDLESICVGGIAYPISGK